MMSCYSFPRCVEQHKLQQWNMLVQAELVTLYKRDQKRCLRQEMNRVHLVVFFIYLFTNHIMIKYVYLLSVNDIKIH